MSVLGLEAQSQYARHKTRRTVQGLIRPLPKDDRFEGRVRHEHAGDDDQIGRDKGREAERQRDRFARVCYERSCASVIAQRLYVCRVSGA